MPCDDMSRRGLFIAAVRRVVWKGVSNRWNPWKWLRFFWNTLHLATSWSSFHNDLLFHTCQA